MLYVAICDDESIDLQIINNYTKDLLQLLNVEYQIKLFTDGKDLLDYPTSFDLIFLDIEMDDMNGIEVSKSLRRYDQETKIIFISNYSNYLQAGYTVRAERYLLKPINIQEFNYEVGSVLKNHIDHNRYILDKRISPYKLYFKDIIYIEFFDRKIIVHKQSDSITTYIPIKEWITLLDRKRQIHPIFSSNLNYAIIKAIGGEHNERC